LKNNVIKIEDSELLSGFSSSSDSEDTSEDEEQDTSEDEVQDTSAKE
jgi:hypothetical protein